MTQAARLQSLEKFRKGEVAFLLATDVAARGLDILGLQVCGGGWGGGRAVDGASLKGVRALLVAWVVGRASGCVGGVGCMFCGACRRIKAACGVSFSVMSAHTGAV